MKIRAKEDCDGLTHIMKAGRVYDVTENIGRHLCDERGVCERCEDEPPLVDDLETETAIAPPVETATARKRTPRKKPSGDK